VLQKALLRVIAVQLGGKTGDYIKATPASGRHSEKERLGTLDVAIIVFFTRAALSAGERQKSTFLSRESRSRWQKGKSGARASM
jgi:hypothetical protein